MRSKRNLAIIGPAVGSRVLFGAIFASFVAVSLAHADSVLMFQLLFLQSGLIALLSASGYARGAQIGTRSSGLTRTFRRFAVFLAIAAAAAIILGAFFIDAPGVSVSARTLTFALLAVGAAASAINGLVQGLAVVLSGPVQAFLPTLISNLIGFLALGAAWNTESLFIATSVWVLPQFLAPIGVLAVSRPTRRLLTAPEPNAKNDNHFATIGAVNTASVGVVYQVRERWAAHHDASLVSSTFYVSRLSELMYQMLYMGVASVPRGINRIGEVLASSAKVRVSVVVGTTAYASGSWILFAIWEAWSFTRVVGAELLLSPIRILASVAALVLLGRQSTAGYIVATSAVAIVGLASSYWSVVYSDPFGIYSYQLIASVSMILIALVVCRKPETIEVDAELPQ